MKHSTYAALLIAVTLAGCRNKAAQSDVPPIEVKVAGVEASTTVSTHTYVGELEEAASLPLSFLTMGKVVEVYVKNGDRVRTGQPLMRLDETQARNSLKSAQAQLTLAEDAFKRVKQVYEQGGATEMKYMEVKSQYETAQSLVALAEKELDNRLMRAPQDGVVSNCNTHVGENLLPSQYALSLLDVNGLLARFSMPEADVVSVHVGDSGTVILPSLNSTLEAVVTERGVKGDPLAHNYEVKMRLLQAGRANSELLPGMVCKVQLKGQNAHGVVIPANCVHTRKNGLAVWVAEGSGSDFTAHRRLIQVDGYRRDGVIVSQGLQEGDLLITDGYQKLYENARITLNRQ